MSRINQGATTRRSELRRAVGTLVILAVLLSIAGGSWLAWGSELELGGARDARPVGEEGRMPADPLAMADMGGVHENYEPVRSFGGVRLVDFLTEEELGAYETAGAAGARMAVSIFQEGKATLAVIQVRDADAARTAAAELVALQEGYGLRLSAPHVYLAKDGSLIRSVYSHENVVVRLEVRGETHGWVVAKTAEIMAAQLEALPADE
ncbi:hypothetical protein FXN61_02585 [Lentzea sp. PSKA42]|uniref:Uncharacterized protein n=1 Tax=Lentzea indica TaxID=2604800 RepID=A0ABX1FAP4_9PSEU|nr:hypothetical protein [Lentzea indica]NKE55766.1 hypothetical protein [Lentzea indica]